jgi:D-hydroxyproline dehydrogenase subunit gamma
MSETIEVTVNGRTLRVASGTSAAAVIALAGDPACRRSVAGEMRAPLCGMGICFECRAKVNGVAHVRTCQVICQPGMAMETDAA